ncbi:AraC family transcriptional regulator [Anaerostipes sp.]|uniref:AraC family transcriptional regulator n=1 Tax=Anaerostipes sp. TaxID=1872530 RepID=UPI0025B80FE8|nr:AraC family transcriptional regulator [Anaerostipes sp.]MBS7008977.1 helix-turn-helix domain-containing protein [Anaerostipes sp.]
MKHVQGIQYKNNLKEELFPDLRPDFPYTSSYVAFDRCIGGQIPWHWHKEVELFYIEKGTLEYSTPGGRIIFPAGSGGLVNSNVLHATKSLDEKKDTIQMNHIFDTALISGQRGSLLEQKYILPVTGSLQAELISFFPETPKEKRLLRLLRDSFYLSPDEFGYEMLLRSALSKLWCLLLSVSEPLLDQRNPHNGSDEKIKSMMQFVQEHYAQKLTVLQIASAAYISERECFRIFRQNLGMTPLEYVKSFRIQQACIMLSDLNMSISFIGQSCGLGSSSYFAKAFREALGCTPKEYRRKWQDFDINQQ